MMSYDEIPDGTFRRASGVASYLPHAKPFTKLHECPGHHRLFHSIQGQYDYAINSVKHEALKKLVSLCKELDFRLRAPLSENDGRNMDVRLEGLIYAITRLHSYSNASSAASEMTHEGYADLSACADLTIIGRADETELDRLLAELKGKPAEIHRAAAGIYRKFAKTKSGNDIKTTRIPLLAASLALACIPPNPLDEDFDSSNHFKHWENSPDKRLEAIGDYFYNTVRVFAKDEKECVEIDAEDLFEFVPTFGIDPSEENSELQLGYQKWVAELTGSIPYIGIDEQFVAYLQKTLTRDWEIMNPDITKIPSQLLPHDRQILSTPVDEVTGVLKKIIPPEKWHIVWGLQSIQEEYCRLFCPRVTIHYDSNARGGIEKHPLLSLEDLVGILWKDFLECVCDVLIDKPSKQKGSGPRKTTWIATRLCSCPCETASIPDNFLKNFDFHYPVGIYCDACGKKNELQKLDGA